MPRTLVAAVGRAWLAQLTCVAAVSMFVAGCDDGADNGSLPSAGEGGAHAGGGGASGGGSTGTAAGSGAGSGGIAGGAAGNQGTSGSGGTGASGGGSLDDVDLTLGGLNQNLQAPSTDCLAGGAAFGCMAISGEYEGEAFDISCMNASFVHTWTSMQYTFGCREDALGSEIEVELIVMRAFVEPAKAFEADASTPSAFIRFWHLGTDFESYDGRMFDLYGLDDSHDQTMAVAGASSVVDVTARPSASQGSMLVVDAAFALSLAPKSGCSPDAMGHGCDAVRLRGTLSAFPVQQ